MLETSPLRLQARLCLGVFLLSSSIFYFEIFTTRLLSFVHGSYFAFYTLAIAMLGLSAGGSFIALLDLRRIARPAFACALLCLVAAGVLVVTYRCTVIFSGTIQRQELLALITGSLSSLYYFLLGACLSLIFFSSPPTDYHKLYSVDLFGGAVGGVLALALLEAFGFRFPLIASIALPLTGSLFFASLCGKRVFFLFGLIVTLGLWLLMSQKSEQDLEPKSKLRVQLSGIHHRGDRVSELWREWTSLGRVSALRVDSPHSASRYYVVQGDGEAPARITAASEGFEARISTAACVPQKILVLFSGAGADIQDIDRVTHGTADITGVEMVRPVYEWPKKHFDSLAKLFSRPNIRMVIGEAREFLARDKNKYNCILLSWSGAPLIYQSGAVGHMASYVYTLEGLSSLVDHLRPDGQITILHGNKLQFALMLRKILEDRKIGNIDGRLMIVQRGRLTEGSDFPQISWAHQAIVFKPDGISQKNREAIAKEFPVYHDGETVREALFDEALHTSDTRGFTKRYQESHRSDISATTDDRPFLLRSLPFKAIERELRFRRHINFLLVLAAGLLLALPGMARNQRRMWKKAHWHDCFYFFSIGAAFMLVESAFVHKMQLWLGHPIHTFAVVLASTVLFAGIGSITSAKRQTPVKALAMASFLSILIVMFGIEILEGYFLGLTPVVKIALAFFVPAIPCFFMGQLFPRGLRSAGENNRGLVPWLIAFNGAGATLATSLSVTMAHETGLRSIFILGSFLYLLVGATPRRQ